MDGISGGRMIVRFPGGKAAVRGRGYADQRWGLGISPRQALTVFGLKEDKWTKERKTGGIFRRFLH